MIRNSSLRGYDRTAVDFSFTGMKISLVSGKTGDVVRVSVPTKLHVGKGKIMHFQLHLHFTYTKIG